jgi:hypothetical protein
MDHVPNTSRKTLKLSLDSSMGDGTKRILNRKAKHTYSPNLR